MAIDDGTPVAPVRGDLGEKLEARIEREEELIEKMTNPRGSRAPRGCSALIALVGGFGLLFALIATGFERQQWGPVIFGGIFYVPMIFVGFRWLFGMAPLPAKPHQEHIDEALTRARTLEKSK